MLLVCHAVGGFSRAMCQLSSYISRLQILDSVAINHCSYGAAIIGSAVGVYIPWNFTYRERDFGRMRDSGGGILACFYPGEQK